jgi:hypothetical protein
VISKPQIAPPTLPTQKVAENVDPNQGPSLYSNGSEKKNCPFCAEEILAVATKCKHCGTDLVDSQQKSNSDEKAMVVKKERSIAPMILGIIGGIIGLPGAVCAGACVVGFGTLAGENDATVQAMGDFYLYLGVITALAGLIFGCLARRKPILSGSIMIASAILGGITIIAGNMFALVASILFLIGGGIAIANKNRPIASTA